jgi:transposase
VRVRSAEDRGLKVAEKRRVTEWNPVFAYVMLELGVGVELCRPHSPQQKAYVSHCTSSAAFVDSSFFRKYDSL